MPSKFQGEGKTNENPAFTHKILSSDYSKEKCEYLLKAPHVLHGLLFVGASLPV